MTIQIAGALGVATFILFVAALFAVLVITANVRAMRKAAVREEPWAAMQPGDGPPMKSFERECPECIQVISTRAKICPWCRSLVSPAISFAGSTWLHLPDGTWSIYQGDRWRRHPEGPAAPSEPNPTTSTPTRPTSN